MLTAALAVLALMQAPQHGPSGTDSTALTPPTPTAEAVAADTGMLRHASGRVPPVAHGTRLTGPAPHIDGRLDDPAWAAAAPITRFYQTTPNEGQPASERTEVRILYDDNAIYVGARLFDDHPDLVRTRLARRDHIDGSDFFQVEFDSYHDHRTGFQFSVNPSGVRQDGITSSDNTWGDDAWDPVWEVKTQRDSLGWSAEMRIPLSQLRFPPAEHQVWGINVARYIQRHAEYDVFAWKAQTDRGNASYFGHLFGLRDLPQPRRLELLPYVTAHQEYSAAVPGDPFHDGSRALGSAGLDVKYGLTSNLTLDATVNPDFGQVEQDPAYVNLSAYEQFLQERRPFFVEGSSIFDFGSGSEFFYSRRIGRPPQGASPHNGFVDTPENSTILGAAKLTGRTAAGWSVGFLEALTAREFATTDSMGTRFRSEVEPATNYVVGRVKRDLNGGATTFGAMFTAVNRDLRTADLAFLRRAAYAGGVDFTHRFSHNRYSVTASVAGSYIRGDTLAIQGAQLSSARYYQRPDAGYVSYDPSRTSLSGWTGALRFSRLEGNWTYGANVTALSPGFEVNDAGFMSRADRRNAGAHLSRRWTRPGRVFRSANVGFETGAQWDFGGIRTNRYAGFNGYGQFLGYWSVHGSVYANGRDASDGQTRGGPRGLSPASVSFNLGASTDYRKWWQVFLGGYHFANESGGWGTGVHASVTLRPSASIQLDAGPSLDLGYSAQQFLLSQSDSLNPAMFGQQYIFAGLRQRSLDITTRLNVTFSPGLSLQLYMQPFVATGAWRDFKELAAPRTTDYLRYGQTPGSTIDTTFNADGSVAEYVVDPDGPGPRPAATIANPDFSIRSLRGNAVLRWEYRPGSTLFLVWTQSCGAFRSNPRFAPFGDLRSLCQGPSDNVLALKVNYWLSL